jgi:hypothetical protein
MHNFEAELQGVSSTANRQPPPSTFALLSTSAICSSSRCTPRACDSAHFASLSLCCCSTEPTLLPVGDSVFETVT